MAIPKNIPKQNNHILPPPLRQIIREKNFHENRGIPSFKSWKTLIFHD